MHAVTEMFFKGAAGLGFPVPRSFSFQRVICNGRRVFSPVSSDRSGPMPSRHPEQVSRQGNCPTQQRKDFTVPPGPKHPPPWGFPRRGTSCSSVTSWPGARACTFERGHSSSGVFRGYGKCPKPNPNLDQHCLDCNIPYRQ